MGSDPVPPGCGSEQVGRCEALGDQVLKGCSRGKPLGFSCLVVFVLRQGHALEHGLALNFQSPAMSARLVDMHHGRY